MDDYPRSRWSYCKGTCIVHAMPLLVLSFGLLGYGQVMDNCGRLAWINNLNLGPHQDMTGHFLPTRVPTKTWLDTSTQGQQPIFLIRWSKRTAWMIFFLFVNHEVRNERLGSMNQVGFGWFLKKIKKKVGLNDFFTFSINFSCAESADPAQLKWILIFLLIGHNPLFKTAIIFSLIKFWDTTLPLSLIDCAA